MCKKVTKIINFDILKFMCSFFSNINVPDMVVEISRSLCILSKHLKQVPLKSIDIIFAMGLTYVTSHIDHFVDSVRNYVKPFFSELVFVAAKHKKGGKL